jgi:hypothetical protein
LFAPPLAAQSEPVLDEPAPSDSKTPYDQHMDNGVKLYNEGNYAGALAEFRAAYKAEPKASPLINQALAYKKLSDYFAAIEVLERALSQHQDSMSEEYQEAARREIRELKALIAYVAVKVEPEHAVLTIDGNAQRPTEGKQIPLGPGPHTFRAEAKGYKTTERRVDLTSGRDNPEVSIVLEATTGELGVIALSKDAVIEVDGQPVGRGGWTGRLAPGVHVVRVIVDDQNEALRVLVLEGGRHNVRQTDSGELDSDSLAPSDDDDDHEFGPPKVLRGFYFTGSAALLTSFFQADEFTADGRDRWGAAGGLNVGYRVAEWAGFQIFGQYSDVRVSGNLKEGQGAQQLETQASMKSIRVGGAVRIMLPGRAWIRFLGTLGLGAAIERLDWDNKGSVKTQTGLDGYQGTDGFEVTPVGQIDLGAELEVSNVLIGLVVQHSISSTKHFDEKVGDTTINVFDTRPMLFFGPQLRVGYGIW